MVNPFVCTITRHEFFLAFCYCSHQDKIATPSPFKIYVNKSLPGLLDAIFQGLFAILFTLKKSAMTQIIKELEDLSERTDADVMTIAMKLLDRDELKVVRVLVLNVVLF